MKYNSFKFHGFIKVSFLFAECICNLILYYIQVLNDSSAEGKHHFKQNAAVGQ